MVADLREGLGGAHDEMGGFLNAEMTEVFLRRHAKGGLEFSQEAGGRKVGGPGEFGDGDVFPVVPVKAFEGRAEFLVFAERGGALIEGARDADDSAYFTLMVQKRFFGGDGPVQKALALGDELDAVDHGFSGFQDAEIIFANVIQDMGRDKIVIPFA